MVATWLSLAPRAVSSTQRRFWTICMLAAGQVQRVNFRKTPLGHAPHAFAARSISDGLPCTGGPRFGRDAASGTRRCYSESASSPWDEAVATERMTVCNRSSERALAVTGRRPSARRARPCRDTFRSTCTSPDAVFEQPDGGRFVGQPPLPQSPDVAAYGWAWRRLDRHGLYRHAPWSLAAKLDPELSIERLRPGVETCNCCCPCSTRGRPGRAASRCSASSS